ncbi:hypothetical protein [Natronococcus roseus]
MVATANCHLLVSPPNVGGRTRERDRVRVRGRIPGDNSEEDGLGRLADG